MGSHVFLLCSGIWQNRIAKHQEIWDACQSHFDAALVCAYEAHTGGGKTAKTFLFTNRFELVAFLPETKLAIMMTDKNHNDKHDILAEYWDKYAIVRTIFKEHKMMADYANYRLQVIRIIDDALTNGPLSDGVRQQVLDSCKEKARDLVDGGSFWWKPGIKTSVAFLGKDCALEFNDVTLEYKCRLYAITKTEDLRAGRLPSFPWDDVLMSDKCPYDPDQVPLIQPATQTKITKY